MTIENWWRQTLTPKPTPAMVRRAYQTPALNPIGPRRTRSMKSTRQRGRLIGFVVSFGALFQFGGCDLGEITATTTLDGREVLINLIRAAIITPIDAYITNGVNNLFDDGDEE
jgi:hypothetical protein